MSMFKNQDIYNDEYYQWREPAHLKQIALISFITGSLYLIMSFVDQRIAPQEILSLVKLFHLILLPSLLYSITILALSKKYYTFMIYFLIFATILASTGHTYIITKLNFYSPYHVEIYLIIFWVFTVSGLHLKHATITAIIISTIAITGILYSDTLTNENMMLHFFWMISSFSFGFAGAYLLEVSNRTVFLQQNKLLQELNNKNVLLKELAHRVKNNLQIVSSILYSQSKKVEDERSNEVLEYAIQTIRSMGMVHEKLYKSENLEAVNFSEYLNTLIGYVGQNLKGDKIDFEIECQDIFISLKSAVPLGLIVNEIITNSMKHAFSETTDKNMQIYIQMLNIEEDEYYLKIADNGKGIDFEELKKNFGIKLIESLCSFQLKASVESYNMDGLTYVIKFKDIKEA